VEYLRRVEGRRAALAACDQRHNRLGFLRVVTVAAAAAIGYASLRHGALSAWWLLLPGVAFFWLGGLLQGVLNDHSRLVRAIAFYDRALERLEGRWAGTGEDGARFLDARHLYADDLDLFGSGSLFQLLSNARTRMGEETLAGWLLAPATPAVVAARQQAVGELAPRIGLREDLAVLGEDARVGVHPEALAAWGERAPLLEPSWFRGAAVVLSVFGAAAVVAGFVYLSAAIRLIDLPEKTMFGMRAYFLFVFLALGLVVWRFKKRTDRILEEVEESAHDLGLLAGVLRRLEAESFSSAHLAALRAALDVEGRPASRRIATLNRLMELVDSRHNRIVQALGPLLLWDLHLSYALEDWRRVSGPAMRPWLNAVGEIEALSSLAEYAYEHPQDVFPEFAAESPYFEGEALCHPLLGAGAAVPNDVRLGGDLRVLVVSGSNMSGKSTLLRTVGVNAVLAQAGAPVRARRLRLSPLAVGSSIRVQDSLQAGASRFYAEITRLRQIMEKTGAAPPVLFLIDEFLHGTNSHDRRIGAEAIVRGLVERGAVGLVTTHDLALAHIAESLAPRGANVHFEDHLEDGRMSFDYKMRPGVVAKSNAIELMRSVGLEV
jgi:MutS domain V